ncbi:opsin-5-like [Mya arenaria]|uniref:opsin-5-like n=1 Tax=Mya arenaria TaxID=6604 RepID=UPI0022E6B34F|nr:opsin-5-like [Mya arenaria]
MFTAPSNTSAAEKKFMSKLEPWEDVIVGGYLCVISISAISLNILVLCTCISNWTRLSRNDRYIVNLAVSDSLMPLSAFPLTIVSSFSHKWIFEDIGCTTYGFLGFYFGLVSITTLAIMALTRYIKICRPDLNLSTTSWSQTLLLFPYLFSLVWSISPLAGWGSYEVEHYGTSCTLQWEGNRTFITLMTFAMCWGFLICWMPYAIVSMWTAYGNGSYIPIRMTLISVLLAKSSTIVNPILYFVLNSKFRPMLIKTFYTEQSKKTTQCDNNCSVNQEVNISTQENDVLTESPQGNPEGNEIGRSSVFPQNESDFPQNSSDKTVDVLL